MSRAFAVPDALSRTVFHPLWDVYDRSVKLKELRRLSSAERESPEAKRARQWERLKAAVDHAYRTCPLYARRGAPPALSSLEDFRNVPVLVKDDVRSRRDELVSSAFRREDLVSAKTGGSTGVSLELLFDKRCEETRNAAALWTNRWSGWDLGAPVGALWGNPPEVRTFKERVRLALLDRTVTLDTVKLDDASMGAFARRLARGGVHFLFGHAHSLYVFSQYVRAHPEPGLEVRGIVSTSMMLLPPERRAIEKAFGCRVQDRYGCEETGLIACECEEGRGLHLNIEHLYVEFLKDDGTPARAGEEGSIVLTDLVNRGMPLLRYKVGDVGVPSDRVCPCGRGLPLMEKVVGRTADFLVAQDGSLVAGVSLVERTLTAIPGLEQMQIVQEASREVVLNVVPDGAFGPASEERLLKEMRTALGEGTRLEVRRVTRLERERNGKYRFAICRVPAAYQ